jgi:hypothetical protein
VKKLYEFSWHLNYAFVGGLFVADQKDVDNAIGKMLYFGEVEGKHSEIYGALEAEEISVISEDQEFVEKFEQLVGEFGYNPLDHIEEDEE